MYLGSTTTHFVEDPEIPEHRAGSTQLFELRRIWCHVGRMGMVPAFQSDFPSSSPTADIEQSEAELWNINTYLEVAALLYKCLIISDSAQKIKNKNSCVLILY